MKKPSMIIALVICITLAAYFHFQVIRPISRNTEEINTDIQAIEREISSLKQAKKVYKYLIVTLEISAKRNNLTYKRDGNRIVASGKLESIKAFLSNLDNSNIKNLSLKSNWLDNKLQLTSEVELLI